ncbi:hypothetical protein B0H12DRAFT_811929 [Mycena haematopus]|nr:hypothetical protein B0H12DRAFT_811929 [Mycena haematopus]
MLSRIYMYKERVSYCVPPPGPVRSEPPTLSRVLSFFVFLSSPPSCEGTASDCRPRFTPRPFFRRRLPSSSSEDSSTASSLSGLYSAASLSMRLLRLVLSGLPDAAAAMPSASAALIRLAAGLSFSSSSVDSSAWDGAHDGVGLPRSPFLCPRLMAVLTDAVELDPPTEFGALEDVDIGDLTSGPNAPLPSDADAKEPPEVTRSCFDIDRSCPSARCALRARSSPGLGR